MFAGKYLFVCEFVMKYLVNRAGKQKFQPTPFRGLYKILKNKEYFFTDVLKFIPQNFQ